MLKIEQNKQMHQVILNACIYAKQEINLAWPHYVNKRILFQLISKSLVLNVIAIKQNLSVYCIIVI